MEYLKENLLKAGNRLEALGIHGNEIKAISYMINDDQFMYLPINHNYENLKIEDIIIYDKNNETPSLHSGIYKNRDEIKAIIEFETAQSKAVASKGKKIPPIIDDMVQILGSSVKIAGSEKMKAICKALKGRNAAISKEGRGICLGRTLNEVITSSQVLQKSCRIFIDVEKLGGAVSLNKFESYLMHKVYVHIYSKRKLKHE